MSLAIVGARRCIFYSLQSSVLLILAWPPISFTPLLFVAFVPLLLVINSLNSTKKVFLYSYLTFFIWTLGTMYWIANTQLDAPGFIIISIAFVLIPFFQAMPITLFFVAKKKWNAKWVWWLLPFFWMTYELMHSHWELSFTWLHLGFGLTPFPSIIQFYEITGYLGGTLLVWLLNILVLFIITNYKRSSLKGWLGVLVATVVLVGFINWLIWPSSPNDSKNARVAIIQNSTDSYKKLDKNSLQEQLTSIKKSVQKLKSEKLDLIVFPEGYLRTSPSAPLVINNSNQKAINELAVIAKEVDAALIIGFTGFKLHQSLAGSPPNALPINDGRYYSAYNGALFIAPDQPVEVQLKNNLVPFMERVPFLEYTSYFESFRLKLNQTQASYGYDNKTNVFEFRDLKIATAICLDALFPDYMRSFFEKRANLIVLIANDSWAGETSGFQQNAIYANSVALSLRKSTVRAATTGISKFIDGRGSSYQETRWNDKTINVKEIPLLRGKTLYAVFGDILGYISVVICSIVVLIVVLKKKYMS